jgi:hypothetical protein
MEKVKVPPRTVVPDMRMETRVVLNPEHLMMMTVGDTMIVTIDAVRHHHPPDAGVTRHRLLTKVVVHHHRQ